MSRIFVVKPYITDIHSLARPVTDPLKRSLQPVGGPCGSVDNFCRNPYITDSFPYITDRTPYITDKIPYITDTHDGLPVGIT